VGRKIPVLNDLTSRIEDSEVHGVDMLIDAEAEVVQFRVEFHGVGSFL
jgi:hypothetical protein